MILILLTGCTLLWLKNPISWEGKNTVTENQVNSKVRFSKIFETKSDKLLEWIREIKNVYDEIDAPSAIKQIVESVDYSQYEWEHWENPKIVFTMKKDFWADKYLITAYGDHYILEKNGKQILELPRNFILTEPMKNFVVNEEWWWFLYHKVSNYSDEEAQALFDQTWEYPEKPRRETPTLIHNGKQISYNEIFWLQNFGRKIFYFFREKADSPIKYYYDWKIYETQFKSLIHNTCGCDEEDALDMQADEENGKLIVWDRNGETLELWLMEIKG